MRWEREMLAFLLGEKKVLLPLTLNHILSHALEENNASIFLKSVPKPAPTHLSVIRMSFPSRCSNLILKIDFPNTHFTYRLFPVKATPTLYRHAYLIT